MKNQESTAATMTAPMTAGEAIRTIQTDAEKIKSDERQEFSAAASPGDRFRQGDLYITLLPQVPASAKRVSPTRLQLAEGTTQGSRHCLDSAAGVEMFELEKPGQLDGPIFRLQETRTITHPEHGDVMLPGDGRCYGVTYQRDLDAEERERRVAD